MKKFILFLIICASIRSYGQSVKVDNSFNSGIGFNGALSKIKTSINNKIVVFGSFNNYNGNACSIVQLINSDGSIDQGFSTGTGFNAGVNTIDVQNDGKIIIGGDFTSYNGSNSNRIVRILPDGNVDNTFNIGTGFNAQFNCSVRSVEIQNDGKILVLGYFTSYNGIPKNCMVRLNNDGSIDNNFIANNTSQGIPFISYQQPDGKIIIGGAFTSVNNFPCEYLTRLDTNGAIDPGFNIGSGLDTYGIECINIQSDGKIIIGGDFSSFNGNNCNNIVRINIDGSYDNTFNIMSGFDFAVCDVEFMLGKILIGGFFNTYNGNLNKHIIMLNDDGSTFNLFSSGDGCLTSSSNPNPAWPVIRDIEIDENNKILIGGNFNSFNNIDCNMISRIKLPNIFGKIYNDVNLNCMVDPQEEGQLNGLSVIIQPVNLIKQIENGFWYLDSLPIGNYSVTIDTTNSSWYSSCQNTQYFSITNPSAFTIAPNFGMVNNNPCPNAGISIFAPTLRRCFSNQNIFIQACNHQSATDILSSSFVDVSLDQNITVNGASFPYVDLGNNIYRFQTGNLSIGQCVNFNISTTVSCNAMLGQTLCMEATLYPIESCVLDTVPSVPTLNGGGNTGTLNGFPQPCTLPWDQSSLSVDGWCANDSIYFTITNTGEPGGGDMECYSPMWITVDGVVTYTDSIMIPGGQTITMAYPGDGATWILNAEQHPLHPGNSHPNAHVEACGDTTNWTPDIVNDFPQDDADPVVDIYCGVVTGSYDPNDKTGYPVGQTVNNYIQPNQQLQYVIRFQNTGTDTAFTVVIRDTLDTDLNIFTVTPGVSSHNYEFRMYGPRVLEWTFENILLPDSTTNQEASNGFVTFHVEQVPDLSPGTEITNDADIYFDFNDPITTNTTMHRIYEGFIEVLSIEELEMVGKSLLVYPNPTSHSIIIKGKEGMNQSFSIFDQMGRIVFNGKLNGLSTEVNLSYLSKGIYTLKIDGNFKPANVIKE